MSIETLTTDEFLELEPEDHREALQQYAETIGNLAMDLTSEEPGSPGHDALLDRMARHFTLRKVHRGRLEEILEETAEAAPSNGTSLPNATGHANA